MAKRVDSLYDYGFFFFFLSIGLQPPPEMLVFAKGEKLKFFWNLSPLSVSFHIKLS